MRLLNASGCLDALTRGVARSLDAFVTKTVTPLPREGTRRRASPRQTRGCSTRSASRTRASTSSSDSVLPTLRCSACRSGSPSEASPPMSTPACARCSTTTARSRRSSSTSRARTSTRRPSTAQIVGRARRRASRSSRSSLRLFPTWRRSPVPPRRGADGLSLVNTMRGLAIDERTLRPKLARGAGGYSGPTLKPIALAAVYACSAATRIPIVAMGGVVCGRDVLEFVAVRHVALGTVLFADRDAPVRIRGEFAGELAAHGSLRQTMRAVLRTNSASTLVGHAQRTRARTLKPCRPKRCGLRVGAVVRLSRHGLVQAQAQAPALARSTHGGAQARERHPGQEGEAEV